MYLTYCIVHIVTLIAVVIMYCGCLHFPNSRAKSAYMVIVFSIGVIVFGNFVEITMSHNISSALVAMKVEYFGVTMMLFGLTDFCSVIGSYKVSKVTYIIMAVYYTVCDVVMFTTGISENWDHGLFYSQMRMDTEGSYSRIKVSDGIFWYVFYAGMTVVMLYSVIRLARRLFGANHIQKKRIFFIVTGILLVDVELVMKAVGMFGSYNFFTVALLVMLVFIYYSAFRCGYFSSVSNSAESAFTLGSDGMLLIDESGQVTFVNNIMKRICPELERIKYASDSSQIYKILNGELKRITADGIVYEPRVEEIKEYNTHYGYMIRFVNITEYLEMLAQLDAASAAKSNFLARVSHEIRTPINTILGMNEMIRRECQDEEIQRYSGNISAAGETLLVLINDILDLSKVESGKMNIVTSDYDVMALFSDVWLMANRRAVEKGLRLSFNINVNMPKMLHGDKVRIKQMLINLLSNSVKYTKEGYIRLEASFDGNGESGTLCVAVADTGIGIKKEDIDRVFDSFERAEENAAEGTGLGLAITKQLAELMDGQLEVESAYGCGTRFTMTLPQKIVDSSAAEPFVPKEAPTVSNSDAPLFVAPNAKILVTDDNLMNRMVIEKLLKRTQVMVDTAESGEQALKMVKDTKYDVILLDAMMPNMDGTQTLHRMKEMNDNMSASAPIIVITANAITGARSKYMAEGFSDYISKPVKPAELERVIGKYISDKCGTEQPPLDREKGMLYCDNDEEFFHAMLKLFTQESVRTLERLEQSLLADDFALFRTQVHGLKNNCRSIGADIAADLSYELEKLSVRAETETIRRKLNELKKRVEHLNSYIMEITFEKEKLTIK